MKKPFFSIIIPAHNEEQTIIPLLHSLYWQTFKKDAYEVIIINNNSSDKTLRIARRCQKMLGELTIKVIDEPRQGVCFARNRGGKSAKGTFLIFLDADNVASPQLLQTIYQKIQNDHALAGTIKTLALEKSLKGDIVYWVLEIIKQTVKRPFGKNFCSKKIFNATGGYDTSHDQQLWYLGTNLDFLLRVKYYLNLHKKRQLTHINSPIFTSVRRFKAKGYLPILVRWGMVYMGVPTICKNILDFLSYQRD